MSTTIRLRGACSVAVAALILLTQPPTSGRAEIAAPGQIGAARAASVVPAAKTATGSMKITISGLPKKAKAKVVVNGAGKQRKVTKSKTLKKLKVFLYDIDVSDVKYGKWWYRGVGQTTRKAVDKGKTTKVKIRYTRAASPTPPATPQSVPLRFDLASAVAVGIASSNRSFIASSVSAPTFESTSTSQTNLVELHADDTLGSALSSGTLDVAEARVAPDGSLYLALNSGVDVDTGASVWDGCMLIRVPPQSDRAECVDSGVSRVEPVQLIHLGFGFNTGNPTIQFDASGGVYYLAYPRSTVLTDAATGIFRKAGGVVTNLTPAGVRPTDFLVTPDGTIFVTGTTNQSAWLRRISPSGQVRNLSTNSTEFLRVFADQNIYFSGTSDGGVGRYLTDSASVDPSDWLGPCFVHVPTSTPHYSCDDLLNATGQRNEFMGVNPAMLQALVVLANGEAVGPLAELSPDNSPGQGWIVRLYPEPKLFRSSVKVPVTAVAAGNEMVVAGTSVSSTQRLIAFDSTTGAEHVLIDGTVKIDQLVYSATSGSLRFSGTRTDDGTKVVGSVKMDSGAVQISPSSDTLLDLEAR